MAVRRGSAKKEIGRARGLCTLPPPPGKERHVSKSCTRWIAEALASIRRESKTGREPRSSQDPETNEAEDSCGTRVAVGNAMKP